MFQLEMTADGGIVVSDPMPGNDSSGMVMVSDPMPGNDSSDGMVLASSATAGSCGYDLRKDSSKVRGLLLIHWLS